MGWLWPLLLLLLVVALRQWRVNQQCSTLHAKGSQLPAQSATSTVSYQHSQLPAQSATLVWLF
jgi:hypothetical protein